MHPPPPIGSHVISKTNRQPENCWKVNPCIHCKGTNHPSHQCYPKDQVNDNKKGRPNVVEEVITHFAYERDPSSHGSMTQRDKLKDKGKEEFNQVDQEATHVSHEHSQMFHDASHCISHVS